MKNHYTTAPSEIIQLVGNSVNYIVIYTFGKYRQRNAVALNCFITTKALMLHNALWKSYVLLPTLGKNSVGIILI